MDNGISIEETVFYNVDFVHLKMEDYHCFWDNSNLIMVILYVMKDYYKVLKGMKN